MPTPFVPQMPLTAKIWTGPVPSPLPLPRVVTPCALYWAKPYSHRFVGGQAADPEWCPRFLFVPRGTDIRGSNGTYVGDTVFVGEPPYFGYFCRDVDDRWRGFPNEYRMAILIPAPVSWVWPKP